MSGHAPLQGRPLPSAATDALVVPEDAVSRVRERAAEQFNLSHDLAGSSRERVKFIIVRRLESDRWDSFLRSLKDRLAGRVTKQQVDAFKNIWFGVSGARPILRPAVGVSDDGVLEAS